MTPLSRRRFLTISAACATLPTVARAAQAAHWRGTALGASASLRLEGMTDAQAAPIFALVEAELARLENIFSLYRTESELTRLNRDGVLPSPAPELLETLALCSALHAASGGAFDPTVQPVWTALATGASESDLLRAQETVGWTKVAVSSDAIHLPHPGLSALTLNGIAQGTITDRIVALLREQGLRNVLVDLGEVAALGGHSDGSDWRVGLAAPQGRVAKRIQLRDRAVATSSPDGTHLANGQGHILGPKGQPVQHSTVSVSARTAALADGLSTALCLTPTEKISPVLAHFADTRLELLI